MNCDILGLQEVNFTKNEVYQNNQLNEIDEANNYHHLTAKLQKIYRCKLDKEFNIDGNALLCRKSYIDDTFCLNHQVLHLSLLRCFQVITFKKGIFNFYVVNVHLHSLEEDETVREFQIKELISYVSTFVNENDILFIIGDFNTLPDTITYNYLINSGFKSLYKEKHNKEPNVTFHTQIDAPFKCLGLEGAYDYIL